MSKKKSARGTMTVREAGALGGAVVASRYSHAHFEELGRKGQARIREMIEAGELPADFHRRAAQRGGERFSERYGEAGYVVLGRSGGRATLARHGRAHFRRLALKSAAAKRAKRAAPPGGAAGD